MKRSWILYERSGSYNGHNVPSSYGRTDCGSGQKLTRAARKNEDHHEQVRSLDAYSNPRKGVGAKCYGRTWQPDRWFRRWATGVIGSQIIGEPGTQLTLRNSTSAYSSTLWLESRLVADMPVLLRLRNKISSQKDPEKWYRYIIAVVWTQDYRQKTGLPLRHITILMVKALCKTRQEMKR